MYALDSIKLIHSAIIKTYVALVVAGIDVVFNAHETVQFIERFHQLLGKVGGSGILEALDQAVGRAGVQASLRVGGHRVN